jgi:hypothetical protein
MPRTPARFRQHDVERALRAMLATGVRGRVEIDRDGRIIVVMVEPAETADTGGPSRTSGSDIIL